MIEDKEKFRIRYPADTEIRFFGTITASVTHELNNVMSIISQTGGLLEDLLSGNRLGRPISPESLERIAGKIRVQTARGTDIVNRLNRFAHSADEPTGAFDLGEALNNLGQLAQRLATLRGAILKLTLEDTTLELEGCQFRILQTVFLVLLAILPEAQKGETITLSLEKNADCARVGIRLDTGRHCEIPDLSREKTIAGNIGADIAPLNDTNGIIIVIRLPVKAPPTFGQ
jgi:C4-dicarboxylate-specific signal transduction histidine kinase